jgi:hypothetical protein
MRTMSNSVNNLGQYLQATHGTVYLSASVIGNDNTIASEGLGFQGIGGTLNAFDQERAAARDAFPLFSS